MANLKYNYQGYTQDIAKLLEGFDLDRIAAYRDHMNRKVSSAPAGSPKRKAAAKLYNRLDKIHDIAGDLKEKFLPSLPEVEKYLKQKTGGEEAGFFI